MPVPSLMVTDTMSDVPLMSHVNGCVKGNWRTPKLATVRLPNWRVSDEESKIVGGEVRPNGFVGWMRTSASVSGRVPAVTLRTKGTGNGDTPGQCARMPSRPNGDGATPTRSS